MALPAPLQQVQICPVQKAPQLDVELQVKPRGQYKMLMGMDQRVDLVPRPSASIKKKIMQEVVLGLS